MIDPPSPIRRHVKWKMAHTKKTGQMTSEATKEMVDKIGSFVTHGRQDVLTAAIGQPEHPSCVRATGASVTINQYFGSAPRTSHAILISVLVSNRVSTNESYVDPLGNDPDTGDSDKCGLYIKENPPRLVALGRIYDGSTIIHNILLLHDQVKVSVEEVRDVDALILLFLKPLQVMWDATEFGVFNEDFPLYIKHEDLSEIAHGGQCLTISVIQLWILAHWQMVIILLKENFVVWFCLLHNRPNNYLKGIINCALKGLDDTPQPKSKAGARWIVVKYFNDARPLEPKRLKALGIQWASII
ncbi:hypothetical protein GmHk_U059771 [Glycine max]|nr:hypothetical protein GmHk_U059771 [Glycine max]